MTNPTTNPLMVGKMASQDPNPIVLAGGACIDVKAFVASTFVLATSNPGRARLTFGGVARNIAENLARLGVPVALLAAVGADFLGDAVLAYCRKIGIDCDLMLRRQTATDLYSAHLSPEGELIGAIAAMSNADSIDAEVVRTHAGFLASARYLVCDANLSVAALVAAAEIAQQANLPLVIDPVSVAKAPRLRALIAARLPIRLMTPNLAELAAIAEYPINTDSDMAICCRRLHSYGVEALIIGLGERGAFVASVEGQAFLKAETSRVCDVTGAGDAALAATLWALRQGYDLLESARAGQYAASLTVASEATVSDAITGPRFLDQTSRR
jgi:pseudouridine kinase